ncbi:hypothetical protein [Mycolicibacterium fortuitum]|uniref:hypothetical protein n=1 Tax=Mycolicibacterium fortuitum TaxID=1766 RepID=UPI00241F5B43|nr:hypothetical protein [Mycolicibacterium fortuitum]MDG5773917.1 hypothetical protein [Mycolicibacterium fortuitum]MDG5779698.1 hypothetical protein [Mycolicibacterium fortuitum]
MTRVLWWATWILATIAAIAYGLLWRELFVGAAITAAVLSMAWGFLVSPETGGRR